MSVKWWLAGIAGVSVVSLCGGFAARTWLDSRFPPETERWIGDDPPVSPSPEFSKKMLDQSSGKNDWRKTSVSVYSAPIAKPDTAPISVKDLSDRAQAQAVDFVVRHPSETESVWNQLTKTFTTSVERQDPYRVDRRLVATVTRGIDILPGDRLLWTRILVRPINFKFAGYTVAATDTKAIRLANVEHTQNSKLTLDAGLTPKMPGLSKQDAGESLEQSRKTTAELNQQYENLGIFFFALSVKAVSAPTSWVTPLWT